VGAVCAGGGDVRHGLEGVEGLEDFSEDLREDDHLGEE